MSRTGSGFRVQDSDCRGSTARRLAGGNGWARGGRLFAVISASAFSLLPIALCPVLAASADWPQLQHDAARSGCNPSGPPPPYKKAWQVEVPDYFTEEAQPVVSKGCILAGSARGVFHCFDAKDGRTRWTFKVGAPVVHAAAAANGRVFFAARDGCVYALALADGKQVWRVETGKPFYSAPLAVGDRILIGNSGGRFFALAQADGAVLWQAEIGQPVLQSAASDGECVFFGDESLLFHALDLETGAEAWRHQVWGESFYGSHPVVAGGKVMTMVISPRPAYPETNYEVFRGGLNPIFLKYHKDPWRPDFADGLRREQEEASAILAEHPKLRTFYVMDAATGSEPYVPAVTVNGENTGIQTAPVLCGGQDSVYLIYSPDCPFVKMVFVTLGRFDLAVGRVVETFVTGYHGDTPEDYPFDRQPFTLYGRTSWWATYDPATGRPIAKLNNWVGDENNCLTASGNWVINTGNAGDADCVEIGPMRRGWLAPPATLPVSERSYAVPAGAYLYCLRSSLALTLLTAVVHDPDAEGGANE